MRLLDALAMAFINTFGITQPNNAQRRRVSWFIAGLLALTVVVVAIAGVAFFETMRH